VRHGGRAYRIHCPCPVCQSRCEAWRARVRCGLHLQPASHPPGRGACAGAIGCACPRVAPLEASGWTSWRPRQGGSAVPHSWPCLRRMFCARQERDTVWQALPESSPWEVLPAAHRRLLGKKQCSVCLPLVSPSIWWDTVGTCQGPRAGLRVPGRHWRGIYHAE
jgi:hypothetical protein